MKKKKETDDKTKEMIIDVDAYDWEDKKLTKKEKLFIVYFTLPFQEGFENPTKAAMKAGYKTKTTYSAKYNILGKDYIKYFVDKFRKDLQKTTIESAFNEIIQEKIKRFKFNVQDYYQCQVYEDEDTGKTETITSLKPLDELTREQASIIDNVQINQSGIATYDLPKKDKIMDDILKLKNASEKEDTNSEVGIETTLQIVKDNIKIALNFTKNEQNSKDFIENSSDLPDYDD